MNVLYGLLLTLAVETPFYFMFAKNKTYKKLIIFIIINLITNSIFNSLYIYVFSYNYIYLIIGEIIVYIAEALLYSLIEEKITIKSLIIPALANLSSFLIGFLFNLELVEKVGVNTLSIAFGVIFVIEIIFFILVLLFFKYRKEENSKV